jgi:type II secretory pathway pseudopilin PulG
MVMVQERGFTLLAVLAAVAILGAVGATFVQYWSESVRREREREWHRIGSLYVAAIERYYEASPVPERSYPRALEDLLADPRFVGTRRHLRALYGDPVSGGAAWAVVPASDGGIMGVRSTSLRVPLRSRVYSGQFSGQNGANAYSDVVFAYRPTKSRTP